MGTRLFSFYCAFAPFQKRSLRFAPSHCCNIYTINWIARKFALFFPYAVTAISAIAQKTLKCPTLDKIYCTFCSSSSAWPGLRTKDGSDLFSRLSAGWIKTIKSWEEVAQLSNTFQSVLNSLWAEWFSLDFVKEECFGLDWDNWLGVYLVTKECFGFDLVRRSDFL